MVFSARGLRLLQSINIYTKGQPDNFDPHNIFNKINIVSLSNGVMKATFTVDETMCNAGAIMHGGFIASVFDTVAAYAQLSLPDNGFALTTNLNLNFFKSCKIGDKLVVETAVLKTGQSSVMEAILKDESDFLKAKSIITFKNLKNEDLLEALQETLNFDVNGN